MTRKIDRRLLEKQIEIVALFQEESKALGDNEREHLAEGLLELLGTIDSDLESAGRFEAVDSVVAPFFETED